jgi:hypothetical protein
MAPENPKTPKPGSPDGPPPEATFPSDACFADPKNMCTPSENLYIQWLQTKASDGTKMVKDGEEKVKDRLDSNNEEDSSWPEMGDLIKPFSDGMRDLSVAIGPEAAAITVGVGGAIILTIAYTLIARALGGGGMGSHSHGSDPIRVLRAPRW